MRRDQELGAILRRIGTPRRTFRRAAARFASLRRRRLATFAVLISAAALVGIGAAETIAAHEAPASQPRVQQGAELPDQLQTDEQASAYGMVASSVPDASRVGAGILEHGGNAVDAAVATAFALGVCDPFYSGIGGISYVLIHLNNGTDVAIDGSPRAPIRVVPEELEALKERETLYGYKTIVAPTMPAVLAFALSHYGTMSLAQVLGPAIEFAEYGHAFLPLAQDIVERETSLTKLRRGDFLSRTFLMDSLDPWPLGHVYCQPVLAATLRRLASHGVADFYTGQIANMMAADILANGGYVSKSDLLLVRPTQRPPTRGRYRGIDVVSFPYPGGGDVVIEMLGILNALPAELLQRETTDRLHVLLDAERIGMHDESDRLIARFHLPAVLDPASLERKAALIRLDRALRPQEISSASDRAFAEKDTTQVSVVDRFGNAVSMTNSLGDGSYEATPGLGFHYNSLLESYDYLDKGSPVYLAPQRVLPTTMAPTILLCAGAPFLVLGSPGSGRIPAIVVSVISNVVDRRMTLRDAIEAPRTIYSVPNAEYPDSIFIEMAGTMTPEKAGELQARGFANQNRLTFPAKQVDLYPFGGVNAVMLDPDTGMLVGVGDPRRQGGAAGQTHR
jgi:gamma-glutamyltranspeptidase/glutathione hydrolase